MSSIEWRTDPPPTDRRFLADASYWDGRLVTVLKWCNVYKEFYMEPNEATENQPWDWTIHRWMELPS